MNIRPMHNRVLVQRMHTRDVTSGGIIIPESAKEQANVAKVLAVGPGRWYKLAKGQEIPRDRLMAVSVGDHVIFGNYAGTDFSHDGKPLLFLREDEIFAIVVDNVSEVS